MEKTKIFISHITEESELASILKSYLQSDFMERRMDVKTLLTKERDGVALLLAQKYKPNDK